MDTMEAQPSVPTPDELASEEPAGGEEGDVLDEAPPEPEPEVEAPRLSRKEIEIDFCLYNHEGPVIAPLKSRVDEIAKKETVIWHQTTSTRLQYAPRKVIKIRRVIESEPVLTKTLTKSLTKSSNNSKTSRKALDKSISRSRKNQSIYDLVQEAQQKARSKSPSKRQQPVLLSQKSTMNESMGERITLSSFHRHAKEVAKLLGIDTNRWMLPPEGAEKMESYIKDGFRIADITANWQGYELDLCLELPYFHPRLTEDNLVLYSEQDAEVVPETPVPKTPAPTPVAVPKPPESTPGEAIAEASEGDVPEAPAATTPRDAIPATPSAYMEEEAVPRRGVVWMGLQSRTEHIARLRPLDSEALMQPPTTYPILQSDFAQETIHVAKEMHLQRILRQHPWDKHTRLFKNCHFLQRLMMSKDVELRHLGVHCVWELGTNRSTHPDIPSAVVYLTVKQVDATHMDLAVVSMNALWALATSTSLRRDLVDMNAVEALIKALRWTYTPPDPKARKKNKNKGVDPTSATLSEEVREKVQRAAMGALAVLVVDRNARTRMLHMDPGLELIFGLTENLPGYSDPWDAQRRVLAVQIAASFIIRDQDVRLQLANTKQASRVIEFLQPEGPGADMVQTYISVAIHGFVLDDETLRHAHDNDLLQQLLDACIATMVQLMNELNEHSASNWSAGMKRAERVFHNMLRLSLALWGVGYAAAALGASGLISIDSLQILSGIGVQTDRVVDMKPFAERAWRLSHNLCSALVCFMGQEESAAVLMAPDLHKGSVLDAIKDDVSPVHAMTQWCNPRNHRGHVRSAALTGFAFLSSHCIGPGELQMKGVYRKKLLQLGVWPCVLEAMFHKSQDQEAASAVSKSGSAALMFLSTEACNEDAIKPWMLVQTMELLLASEDAEVTGQLLVTVWLLARDHSVRKTLRRAVQEHDTERDTFKEIGSAANRRSREKISDDAKRRWREGSKLAWNHFLNSADGRPASVSKRPSIACVYRSLKASNEATAIATLRAKQRPRAASKTLWGARIGSIKNLEMSWVEQIEQRDRVPSLEPLKPKAVKLDENGDPVEEEDHGEENEQASEVKEGDDQQPEDGDEAAEAGVLKSDEEIDERAGDAASEGVSQSGSAQRVRSRNNKTLCMEDWWGLKVLVNVTDNWKQRVVQESNPASPVVKVAEFLVLVTWVYMIADDKDAPPRRAQVNERVKANKYSTWWMVEVETRMATIESSKQHVIMALEMLMWLAKLPLAVHTKTVQLALGALWNMAVRRRPVEARLVEMGLVELLSALASNSAASFPLRDTAGMFLAELLSEWENSAGTDRLTQAQKIFVGFIDTPSHRLQACGLRCLGHMSACAPVECPNPMKCLDKSREIMVECGSVDHTAKLLEKMYTASVAEDNQFDPQKMDCEEEDDPNEFDAPKQVEIGSKAMMINCLRLFRNLSVAKQFQTQIAKLALTTLVRISSYFTQKIKVNHQSASFDAGMAFLLSSDERQISNLANGVLTNLATNSGNRTAFYKLELQGTLTNTRCRVSVTDNRTSSPPKLGPLWVQEPPTEAPEKCLKTPLELAGVRPTTAPVPAPSSSHPAPARPVAAAVGLRTPLAKSPEREKFAVSRKSPRAGLSPEHRTPPRSVGTLKQAHGAGPGSPPPQRSQVHKSRQSGSDAGGSPSPLPNRSASQAPRTGSKSANSPQGHKAPAENKSPRAVSSAAPKDRVGSRLSFSSQSRRSSTSQSALSCRDAQASAGTATAERPVSAQPSEASESDLGSLRDVPITAHHQPRPSSVPVSLNRKHRSRGKPSFQQTIRPKAYFRAVPENSLPSSAPSTVAKANEPRRWVNQSQSDKARDVTLEKKKKFMEWAHGTFSQADVANSLNRATGITLPESMVHLGHGSLNKELIQCDVIPDEDVYEGASCSLQKVPQVASVLNQILRKPLSHMWEPPDELVSLNRGNNRWCPEIKQYIEREHESSLSRVAGRLLHTKYPEQAVEDHLRRAKDVLTGSVVGLAPDRVSVERPSTAKAMKGRKPRTVLKPHLHPVHAGSAAAAKPAPRIELSVQVAESAQKRNHMSFETKDLFLNQFDKQRPVLVAFEHVPGAKVHEGLFPEYHLPNGRSAFFYYSTSVLEEMEVPLKPPPPLPVTLKYALQPALPLLVFLPSMSKMPGSAPPMDLAKPVPPLAPLPSCHKLKVVDARDVQRRSSFGDLEQEPLQFRIVARRVRKMHMRTERTELTPEEIEDSSTELVLEQSVFAKRATESDAKDYVHSNRYMMSMLEIDWERCMFKDKFSLVIKREFKVSNSTVKDEREQRKIVYNKMMDHYHLVVMMFDYYQHLSSTNFPFLVDLDALKEMLDNLGIPLESDSSQCRIVDIEQMFIACNHQTAKNSQLNKIANNPNALMRFEFMELCLRMAFARCGKGVCAPEVAIEKFFSDVIVPSIKDFPIFQRDSFRKERLYTNSVNRVFKQYEDILQTIYIRYADQKIPGKKKDPKLMNLQNWLQFLKDAVLLDKPYVGLEEAKQFFISSRMHSQKEELDYVHYTCLTYTDFLEALGRLADVRMLPMALELSSSGWVDVFEWFLAVENKTTKEGVFPIPRRQSAEMNSLKTRPLSEKVNALLDVMAKRLHLRFVATEGEDAKEYSAESLLECLKIRIKQSSSTTKMFLGNVSSIQEGP